MWSIIRRVPAPRVIMNLLATAALATAVLSVIVSRASALPASSAPVTGYDISFPQCGGPYPSGQDFGIVGVNDGLPGTLNPCFGPSSQYQSELYWAVETSAGPQPTASLYVNTDDPGDVYPNGTLVPDWPSSGSTPYGDCTATTVTTSGGPAPAGANSQACAWMYGAEQANEDLSWLSQAASAIDAQAPPIPVSGSAGAYPWWLDVETANLWQPGSSGQAMNVAVLEGMVAALNAAGASSVGVYSADYDWSVITGGVTSGPLGSLAAWVPGAGSLAAAEANCSEPSFNGGPVALAQWTQTYDGDVVCGSSTAVSSVTPLPTQIYGTDAIGTSIAISQQEFPNPGSASAVVLARSDFFSDALAGGPLAAAVHGPLLITPGASQSSTLDPRVQAEIQRVLPQGGTVYILGGPLAISPNVDLTLEGLGYKVVREAGSDEYATAVDIAEALGNPKTIFLATGLNFYDALSSVPAAIEEGAAILLTDGSTQAPETAAYLGEHPGDTVYAIGGPEAAYGADPSAIPVYGQDLFGTAAAVATRFFPNAAMYGAATDADFPDALGGGVFMATGGRLGPMLLVDPGSATLAPSVAAYLGTLAPNTPGFVFGGPLAVPGPVLSALQAAVG